MGNRPSASVVILSHRPAMVPEALQSALHQTEPTIEVRVEFSPLLWAGKLNDAVTSTAGEGIVILCDDDQLAPTFVAECLDALEHGDIVYTDRRDFNDGENPATGIVRRYHKAIPEGATAAMTISPGTFFAGSPLPMTCMIRRQLWTALGGYDELLPHADTEFMFRAIHAGAKMVYVAKPLFYYRFHEGQVSRTPGSMVNALRAFHAKHRDKFGVTFADQPDAHGILAGEVHHA